MKILPKDSIVFRPMLPGDKSVVASMIKSLYQSLGAPESYVNDDKIKLTFDQFFNHPGSIEIEVFEVKREIVGYALLFSYWYNEYGGRVLNIDELFVKQEFRSRGVAAEYLTELGKRTEYVAHTLEVLPENKGAYALYKRNGFEEKDTITLYRMVEV